MCRTQYYVKFWFSQSLEKNCKRKEPESYANIFFHGWEDGRAFLQGETKEFYFISIRYHIGEKH